MFYVSGYCIDTLTGVEPVSSSSCYKQCAGDCILTEWSEYSECSQTCGLSPGHRTRTRVVINAGKPHIIHRML